MKLASYLVAVCLLPFSASLLSAQTNCVTPPGNFVGWWPGEGNGFSVVGSTSGTLLNETRFTNGVVGQAFNFDGTDNHLRIVDQPALRATNALTLEAWVHPTDPGAYRSIISKWDLVPGREQRSYDFTIHPASFFYLTLSGNGRDTSIGVAYSAHLVPVNQWSHLAATYDGATIKLYFNGALDTNAAFTAGIFPGTNDLGIGGVVGGGAVGNVGAPFAGRIDEPAVYNRALSAEEIQGIYLAGSAGKCRETNGAPVIYTQPLSQSILLEQTASLSVTAGGGEPLYYQWFFNGEVLAAATNSALVLPNISSNNVGNYRVAVSNLLGTVLSSNAFLSVLTAPPTITIQPASRTVDAGSNTTFTISAQGPGGLSYQWYFKTNLLGDATSPSLVLNNVATNQAGLYFATVTSPYGSVTSAPANLVVRVNPVRIVTQPASQFAFVGDSVTLSPLVTGTLPITYQWRSNGVVLAGATNVVLQFPSVAASDAAVYTLRATNYYGTAASLNATLTVAPGFTNLTDDFEPQIDSNRWSEVSSVTASTNHGGAVSPVNSLWFGGTGARFAATQPMDTTTGGRVDFYLRYGNNSNAFWMAPNPVSESVRLEYAPNGSSAWLSIASYSTNLSEWTKITATIPTQARTTATRFRWRQLSNSGANADHWALDDILIRTIAAPPVITEQPKSLTVDSGSLAAFAVKATGSAVVRYQWSFNGTNLAGATTSRLVVSNALSADVGNYAVALTNDFGFALSSNAVLNVVAAAPVIVSQPASLNVEAGQPATISLVVTGSAPLSYQWFFNNNPLTGPTNGVLFFPAAQLANQGTYYAVVSNAFGSVTSSNAVLTVTEQAACATPPAGLVGWWRAENDVLNTVGGVAAQLLNGGGFTNGRVGQAFALDGAGDHVRVAYQPGLQVSNVVTLEAWVYPTSHGAYHSILSTWDLVPGRNQRSYDFTLHPEGFFYLTLSGDGTDGPIGVAYSTPHVPLNQWSHLAATYDGAAIRLYLNGNLETNVPFAGGLFASSNEIGIGGVVGGGSAGQVDASFAGRIDEPSIYRRALSGTEILALYGAGGAGKCAPIITNGPPQILVPPASQTVVAGTTVTFSVEAIGSAPIGYQWLHNGTNLPGQTASSYVLTNAQVADSGNYAVLVTNLYGMATSSNAILTVLPVESCAPAPGGLLGWWKGEENYQDQTSVSAALIPTNILFAPGQVGSAFVLNGSNAALRLPAASNLNVGLGAGFTVEAWINPQDVTRSQALAEWNDGLGAIGVHFWHSDPGLGGFGALMLDVVSTNGQDFRIASPPGQLVTGQYQHVAASYDRSNGVAKIYYNGAEVASQAIGSFTPRTDGGLYFGTRPSGQETGGFYAGALDEPSLYGRALNANEVAALYHAGSQGKCAAGVTNYAPGITLPPTNQTVLAGTTVTFTVEATGTAPLSYQWLYNGTNLPGQTASSYVLANAQVNDSGYYAVSVTNLYGAVTSSNAVLTVVPLPPECVTPPAGLVGWWKGESNVVDQIGGGAGQLLNGAGYAAGKVGGAFDFDGTNDHVRIPHNPSLAVSNLTVEAWVYPTSHGAYHSILSRWDIPYGRNQRSYDFTIHPYGFFYLTLSGDGTDNSIGVVYSTNNVPVNEWSHLAATYDGATIRIYFNGRYETNAAFAGGIFAGANDLGIGGVIGGGAENQVETSFAGRIDEPSLYGRALSGAEILAIYDAGSQGKCAAGVTNYAPGITLPPTNQTVLAGTTVTFTVEATGTAPLSYQWLYNGTNLPGQTASSYVLANAQVNDSGYYAVRVTNLYGAVISSNAVLTVLPLTPECVTPPVGLVGWWKGESNVVNQVAGSSGQLLNDAGFAPGEVGLAFNLGGSNAAHVRVPHYPALAVTNLTVEAWVYPTNRGNYLDMISKWDLVFGPNQKSYDFAIHPEGIFYLILCADGNDAITTTGYSTNAVPLNQWSHLAATYDGSKIRIYYNGSIQSETIYTGGIFPGTNALGLGALIGGATPGEAAYSFAGKIDEASIYNRALSGGEVQALFAAGSQGKCVPTGTAPVITEQPTNIVVAVGGSAAFRVSVIGTEPFVYQWLRNGTNLVGRTNALLTLFNVSAGDQASYAVAVANAYGSVLSSNAVLEVLTPGENCLNPPAGLVGWWRGESNPVDSVGGPAGRLLNGAGYAAGRVGRAFDLDGANDHVRIPHTPSLAVSNLTVEAWVYPTAHGAYHDMISKWDLAFGKNQKSYDFAIHPYGFFYLILCGDGNDAVKATVYSTNNLPLNEWSHIAATYNGSSIKIYYNGGYQTEVAYTGGIFPGTNDLGIGGLLGGAPEGEVAYSFAGKIDEPSIYNRALSNGEIQALYLAGSQGKCAAGVTNYPPGITVPPTNQTVVAGTTVTFTVEATGTAPLSYQWLYNGTNLPGRTASSYVLADAQVNDSGYYAVSVTNLYGAVTSSNAVLTVLPAGDCAASPSGLVGWWKGEGNFESQLRSQSALYRSNIVFGVGKVGSAFVLSGTNSRLTVTVTSNLNVGLGAGFTFEAWIKPEDLTRSQALAEWNGAGSSAAGIGVHFWHSDPGLGGLGALMLDVVSTNGQDFRIASPPGQLVAGVYQHVAASYDKSNGVAKIYYNGAEVASQHIGSFTPRTMGGLYFGTRPAGQEAGSFYAGALDEPSVYGRALTANEVAAIYNAGSHGKCPVGTAPVIINPPVGQVARAGDNVTFTVTAGGSAPLTYQWRRSASFMPVQTAATLVLSNVQPADADGYAVIVRNDYGSVTSSFVALTITAECSSALPGLVSWWPGQNNLNDHAGTNNGLPLGDLGYVPGKVGNAFYFTGQSNGIYVPPSSSLDLGAGDGMTVEGWILPNDLDHSQAIVEWNDGIGNIGVHFWHSDPGLGGLGSLMVNLLDTNGLSHRVSSQPQRLNTNGLQHVAFTYNRSNGTARVYYNGVDTGGGNVGSLRVQTTYPLNIGYRASGYAGPGYYGGILDELSFYNRSLTPAEIQSIYLAGGDGKACTPPAFVTQPQGTSVNQGGSLTLSAMVRGATPLLYQWYKDGNPLAGATQSSLALTNVQGLNGGNYSLRATNALGFAISSNALVQVSTITARVNGRLVPVGGLFTNGPATVQLHTTFTNGLIFYTLDGTAPTFNSQPYTGPFALNQSAVLRALAYSANFLQDSEYGPATLEILPFYPVALTVAGGGFVNLTPAGNGYASNSFVNFEAVALPGWHFMQWLGDINSYSPLGSFELRRPLSARAVFGTDLQLTVAGEGIIEVDRERTASGYPYGTQLRLTAVPAPGNRFVLWGDSAGGSANPLAVTVTNANRSISALFAPLETGKATVTAVTEGRGTATITPAANAYNLNSTVTLTATPEPGQTFQGWSGDASGDANPLTLTVNGNLLVVANFSKVPKLAGELQWNGSQLQGMRLTVTGEPYNYYRLNTSADGVQWNDWLVLTNTLGTIQLLDHLGTNSIKFYQIKPLY